MGMFSKDYEKEAEKLWKDVEKDIRPKDGLKHVLNIYRYTKFINFIIEKMQNEGYEIIDIKVVSSSEYSVESMIIYK